MREALLNEDVRIAEFGRLYDRYFQMSLLRWYQKVAHIKNWMSVFRMEDDEIPTVCANCAYT